MIPIDNNQIAKTTAQWESLNPVLAVDVIGIEVMSNGYNRFKRGNGSTAWKSLPYLDKVYNIDYATNAGNADTVDNKHASDFAASNHNHDAIYAPNVSSFKNLGNLGRFTSQTSLNNLLDNLTGDKYGNVENIICYLGVDFQSSQPYGWAAGSTVIATGGGTYSSQVLTGATGVFHRVLHPEGWLPWKRLGGVEWGEVGLRTSSSEVTVTKTFAAAPVGMVVDTDITTYTSAATNKAAYLLNQDYFRDVVSTATGSVKAKLYNKTLSISCKLTQMAYVRYLAIYN